LWLDRAIVNEKVLIRALQTPPSRLLDVRATDANASGWQSLENAADARDLLALTYGTAFKVEKPRFSPRSRKVRRDHVAGGHIFFAPALSHATTPRVGIRRSISKTARCFATAPIFAIATPVTNPTCGRRTGGASTSRAPSITANGTANCLRGLRFKTSKGRSISKYRALFVFTLQPARAVWRCPDVWRESAAQIDVLSPVRPVVGAGNSIYSCAIPTFCRCA
jgi:hypothetical protein